jgi:hypothetical protein
MTQRFALYNGLHHGSFSVPEAVYDTPEEAADAARALVLHNISTRRIESCGDPSACAVLVLPVPAWPGHVPDCLRTKETP